uniref:hypothetical protein n=1 Tax=Acetatifactor sp. TaxID=1872090 RepID=UPI004056540F
MGYVIDSELFEGQVFNAPADAATAIDQFVEKKNRFEAKECNFQGVPGYMVKQYRNNIAVCEQFVSQDAFGEYRAYLLLEGYFEN